MLHQRGCLESLLPDQPFESRCREQSLRQDTKHAQQIHLLLTRLRGRQHQPCCLLHQLGGSPAHQRAKRRQSGQPATNRRRRILLPQPHTGEGDRQHQQKRAFLVGPLRPEPGEILQDAPEQQRIAIALPLHKQTVALAGGAAEREYGVQALCRGRQLNAAHPEQVRAGNTQERRNPRLVGPWHLPIPAATGGPARSGWHPPRRRSAPRPHVGAAPAGSAGPRPPG